MSLHVNKIAQMLIKQINIWETQLYIVAFIVAFKKKKQILLQRNLLSIIIITIFK